MELSKYIIDLCSSVSKINNSLLNVGHTNNAGNKFIPQHTENNTVAELYRHFRNQMDNPYNRGDYNNLQLHFDITKADIRPDLVLHRAQENNEDQRLFIEVKVNPNADLNKDISKLVWALRKLKFKEVCLVLFKRGYKESEMRKWIEEYKLIQDECNRFHIITRKGMSHVEIIKLSEFI